MSGGLEPTNKAYTKLQNLAKVIGKQALLSKQKYFGQWKYSKNLLICWDKT